MHQQTSQQNQQSLQTPQPSHLSSSTELYPEPVKPLSSIPRVFQQPTPSNAIPDQEDDSSSNYSNTFFIRNRLDDDSSVSQYSTVPSQISSSVSVQSQPSAFSNSHLSWVSRVHQPAIGSPRNSPGMYRPSHQHHARNQLSDTTSESTQLSYRSRNELRDIMSLDTDSTFNSSQMNDSISVNSNLYYVPDQVSVNSRSSNPSDPISNWPIWM